MGKLEQLIEELCPNGVEFKYIWEVTAWDKRFNIVDDYKQKKIIKYTYYLSSALKKLAIPNGTVKILTTNKTNLWANEDDVVETLSDGEIVCIPWGGNPIVQYYKGKFVTGDNRIATSLNVNILDNKFLYYCMQNKLEDIASFYRGSGIKHPNMSKVLDISIPIPPLPVQSEIVRILDNFTELTAELTTELTARRKQYEYYRDCLLKNSQNQNKVPLKTVVKKSCSGGTPKKNKSEFYSNGTIPWLRTQDVKFNEIYEVDSFITEEAVKKTSAKWIPANCVIVAISGATAGRCAINKIPITTNQHCYNMEIDESKALYKYVYYCVCSQYEELISKKQGARGDLNSTLIMGIEIPIPYAGETDKSLMEQQRIVDILDRFDTLCNDISKGLPAEINERQKQYEYYRNKLLTFKNINAEV